MELVAGVVLGVAINQYRVHSKIKKAMSISQKATERVAEAEVKLERHRKAAENAYNALSCRITSAAGTLTGQFASVLKPFEHMDGSILEDLFGVDCATKLVSIEAAPVRTELAKLSGYKKQTGMAKAVNYFFFGPMGEANRQLDAARTQSRESQLIATHCDTICQCLDIQKENYTRVYQVLGALNAALIVSSNKANTALEPIQWLLDDQGHIPADMSSSELKTYLTSEGMAQIANSINVAKVLLAILEKPIFNENAEISERTQKMLNEGEAALNEIKQIKEKRG